MSPESIASIISGGLGFLMGLIVLISSRRKDRAQAKHEEGGAAEEISEAWKKLNKPLIDRVDRLEAEVGALRECLDANVALLVQHHIKPVPYKPPVIAATAE